jgi:hypothetical protein
VADVTVFVDDAVRGRLPAICAKDGIPTSEHLRVSTAIGNRAGLGVAWLLLFAGPLGWLALVAISLSRSGRVEQLTTNIPLSEASYERLRASRRLENLGFALVVATVILGLVLLASASDSTMSRFMVLGVFVAFVAGLVMLIVGNTRQSRERVDIELDASRRWVRLSRVHPNFAAACEAQEAATARHERA